MTLIWRETLLKFVVLLLLSFSIAILVIFALGLQKKKRPAVLKGAKHLLKSRLDVLCYIFSSI